MKPEPVILQSWTVLLSRRDGFRRLLVRLGCAPYRWNARAVSKSPGQC